MFNKRWAGLFLPLRRWQEAEAWEIFSQPASGTSVAPKHEVTSFHLLEAIFLLLMLLEHEKLPTNQSFKQWFLVFLLVQVYSSLFSSKVDLPRTHSMRNTESFSSTQIKWLAPVTDSTEHNLETKRKEVKISHEMPSFPFGADTSTRIHIQLHNTARTGKNRMILSIIAVLEWRILHGEINRF